MVQTNLKYYSNILVNFEPNIWQNLDGVRPNGSAEPSVEMTEPFGFGRTTFLAVRSFTSLLCDVLLVQLFYLLFSDKNCIGNILFHFEPCIYHN